MRARFAVLTLLFVGLSVDMSSYSVPAMADTPPAAVLMTVHGKVTVSRAGGQEIAGSFGLALQSGDRVKTGAGSEAEIMLEDGTWLQIGAGSGMQIKSHGNATAAETEKTAAGKNFEVVQNFIRLKGSEGSSAITGLRSGEKSQGIMAITPCQTKVLGSHPLFQWEIADPSTELRLTLYNGSGVVWTQDVHNIASLQYPGDAPELTPGVSYSWILETTDPMMFPPLRSKAAYFEVLAVKEAAMLDEALAAIEADKKPGKTAYHLMRASIFFDQGLLDEAIRETQVALEADPDNPSLHAILGRLYAEIGQTREAVSHFGQAVERP